MVAQDRKALEDLLHTLTDRIRFLTAGGTPPDLGVGAPPSDNGILGPVLGLTLYEATTTHVLPYVFGAALLLLMLPLIPYVRRGEMIVQPPGAARSASTATRRVRYSRRRRPGRIPSGHLSTFSLTTCGEQIVFMMEGSDVSTGRVRTRT